MSRVVFLSVFTILVICDILPILDMMPHILMVLDRSLMMLTAGPISIGSWVCMLPAVSRFDK